MTSNGPTQYQGLPPQDTPLVDSNGKVNLAWYRFFQSIHGISGAWALPIIRYSNHAFADYANPLILYHPPNGGSLTYGALRVYDPTNPGGVTGGGLIVMTSP